MMNIALFIIFNVPYDAMDLRMFLERYEVFLVSFETVNSLQFIERKKNSDNNNLLIYIK